MLGLLLFAVVLGLLLLGFPVAWSLGGISIVALWWFDPQFLGYIPSRIFGVLSNQLLMAVPLFVFMGVMLEKSGLAEDLLEDLALACRRLRGGQLVGVVIVGALLAASTGIVGATVVTLGLLSLPTLLRNGHDPGLSAGTVCAAGTLGQIIPPSIVLVLLGDQLQVPTGDLFLAALAPGLLIVVLYLLYVVVASRRAPSAGPASAPEEAGPERISRRRLARSLLPPLLLMISVLGSIFAGIASPTEAAAVGALGATLLTWTRKRLGRSVLHAVAAETAHLTAMVFTILIGATIFGLAFRGLHGDAVLQGWIAESELGPQQFVALFLLLIFVAGFFIDFIEITFIHVPVAFPLFQLYDLDLLWVGILIAINLQTSFLTPPFGFSLFYLKGVAPSEFKTADLYRGVAPFVAIQLLVLLLVFLFPALVTWLPKFLSTTS